MDGNAEPSKSGEAPAKKDVLGVLPGNEATWKESQLHLITEWPESLRTLVLNMASFTYPSGIFMGQELILLHNEAWANTSGLNQQGKAQAGRLPSNICKSLQTSLQGGKSKQLRSYQLLGSTNETNEIYTVLLSQVFKSENSDDIAGVLVQMIPKASAPSSPALSNMSRKQSVDYTTKPVVAASGIDQNADQIPLDEHPFFHRFAEMLPTGLAILDRNAQAIFVNQLFYELTTSQDGDQSFKAWPQSIHPEDYDRVMSAYSEAFRSQTRLRTEFRSSGHRNPWRLLLLTPLGDDNLNHISLRDYGGFLCCIVDITSEKSAELSERKAAKEAKERKDQQERFIDMISHEIRNPLSAILHCTEDIEVEVQQKAGEIDKEVILQATETINICIVHQRNIVDDVLSYSKLDSSMLSLVPKPCQPRRQLADSLKMFEPEFRKQEMDFQYCIDTSYEHFNLSWLMADLARIGQVVVNLVANAIKFTARSDGERKVTVSLGASRLRPTSYPPNIVFFNSDDLAYRLDATNNVDWGNGETMYLMVAVKDTGIGISDDAQKKLFERFRQATPKTAEIYGGSGLGLNISRKLCHLHGGEIGVASKEGEGSTFGFFFKARRTDPPRSEASRLEKEQDEVEKFEEHIDNEGLALPDEVERSLTPASLRAPPVVKVNESVRGDAKLDERYYQTARIAAKIEEPDADQYGNKERPQVSNEHQSGEFLQSKDVSRRENKKDQDQKTDNAVKEDRRPHILLAEDNIINQRILFRKLEKHNFNVTTANNGQEALDGVRDAQKLPLGDKRAFDIILMDQEMPVMDGNAAAKKIRSLERDGGLKHVPILGVTANVRDDQQNEMIANGMDEVISKPYKIEELVTKINKLLGSKEES